MHGLINRAFQGFLIQTYGRDIWDQVSEDIGPEFDDFEVMLSQDPATTQAIAAAAAYRLDRSAASMLEDVGTWLISDPMNCGIRRLLRFGGTDFREFLHSLEELPGRARMAIPHIAAPDVTLCAGPDQRLRVKITWPTMDLTPVALGALRAMADDYGALVLIDTAEVTPLSAEIEVELLDNRYADGRSFSLAGAGR